MDISAGSERESEIEGETFVLCTGCWVNAERARKEFGGVLWDVLREASANL